MDFAHLPGVFRRDRTPALTGPVRLDVPVFVGVSPRGPARVPVVDPRRPVGPEMVDPLRPRLRSVAVPVDGIDTYRRLFGAPSAGGYLGRSVEAFFAQGGRRCHVMRIVHRYLPSDGANADPFAGCARGETRAVLTVDGFPAGFIARDEGRWGNTLRLSVRWNVRPVLLEIEGDVPYIGDPGSLPPGTRLRLQARGTVPALASVEGVTPVREARAPWTRFRLDLDSVPAFLGDPTLRVEALDFSLEITDGDGNSERHERLSTGWAHPRYAGLVLCRDSRLVYPDPVWSTVGLEVPTGRASLESVRDVLTLSGGEDRGDAIVPSDFVDETTAADFEADDADEPSGEGLGGLRGLTEPALLLVPDLYHPPSGLPGETEGAVDDVDGAAFAECVESTASAPVVLEFPGLTLDPRRSEDLAEIVRLQRLVVRFAEARAHTAPLTALLDVPPGLSLQAMGRWRRAFDCPDAAAYLPWVHVAGAQPGGRLVRVPPSACAAGVIAARETARDVAHGPAGVVIARAVQLETRLCRDAADALFTDGLNVIVDEARGLVLTGARTLSRDRDWRALATRRVFQWVVRFLQRESPWLVFETNTPRLHEDIAVWLGRVLRRLWQAGWLTGSAEDEAFFVNVTDDPRAAEVGRLIVEIGLAVVEPIEFVVVRLSLSAEGLDILGTRAAAVERGLLEEAV